MLTEDYWVIILTGNIRKEFSSRQKYDLGIVGYCRW